MSVKAKFKCTGANKPEGYDNTHITLSAVIDGSEENKSFSKYTPAGEVSINISDETPAADYFKIGKEYYLTFNEAPE